MAAEKKY